MRFTILGPVRAWLGDAELETGPPTQRALLALLLVHAGQPVALSEIVDTLWDQDPPRTAVNIVHRHVGALRRLFDPGLSTRETGRLLLPSSGGYRMDVDPDTLDLLRFRRLSERARQEGSVDLFDDALVQWQGPIAAGIPEQVRTRPAFVAVEREYLAVLQEAADAALSAGQPDRFRPAMQQAATAHPLNEGLQAHLILALAATGHQAEALETYRAVRDRLADELGIDPGPELREVHARVLSQSPVKKKPAVPTQLPGDLPTFTGRRTELARTAALLTGRDMTTLAIFGMAGVGKTTLAVHLAHEVADHFPDGQLYVNLHGFDPVGVVSTSNAVRGFLETLGVAPNRMPADLDGQTALYRSMLAGKRMLVLIDDARDTEHVRPMLPGAPGCMVIITSRTQLRGLVARSGAHPLALGLPTSAEARDIFVRRLGDERVTAEAAAVDEIISLCGRLPLALAVVAARAATYPTFPLASIVDELRRSSLDAFNDTDPDIDVRTVFSWSYQAVSPEAARLFRLLALHPGPDISTAAAASLAGLPDRQTRGLLDDLTHAHLINEQVPGRYVFHDLLRAYAAELGVDDAEAARGRLFDHYLQLADAATGLLFPYRNRRALPPLRPDAVLVTFVDHQDADESLRTERPVLQALAAYAAETGFAGHAWRIASAIELFMDRQGRWQEQITLQRTALTGAELADDRVGRAYAHRALGFAIGRVRHVEEADEHLHLAQRMYDELHDVEGLAITHRNMAFLANRQSNYHHALTHYDQALALYESDGNQSGQASVFNEVGWTYILLGEYERALGQCQRALELHKAIGNRNGEAAAADSLGYAYHHLGRHEEAIARYQHALAVYQEITDRYLSADTLVHIGDAKAALGDRDAAGVAWREALLILDELGHPEAAEIRGKLRVIGAEPDQRPLLNGADSRPH